MPHPAVVSSAFGAAGWALGRIRGCSGERDAAAEAALAEGPESVSGTLEGDEPL